MTSPRDRTSAESERGRLPRREVAGGFVCSVLDSKIQRGDEAPPVSVREQRFSVGKGVVVPIFVMFFYAPSQQHAVAVKTLVRPARERQPLRPCRLHGCTAVEGPICRCARRSINIACVVRVSGHPGRIHWRATKEAQPFTAERHKESREMQSDMRKR